VVELTDDRGVCKPTKRPWKAVDIVALTPRSRPCQLFKAWPRAVDTVAYAKLTLAFDRHS
jgi:hypothetical protein